MNMIHCIGDSHSCFFSGEDKIQPTWPEQSFDVLPYFRSYRIGPSTAYNLNNKKENIIEPLIQSLNLSEKDKLLFCFGEVDCRAHLIKQSQLQNRGICDIINECVFRYISSIKYYTKYTSNIWVWGPIASWNENIPYTGPSYGTNKERNLVTQHFNKTLEEMCKREKFGFITFFYDMLNGNMSTDETYLDDWEGCHIHLSQRSMPIVLDKFKEKKLIE